MLRTVLDRISQELENSGAENIYTSFDYIPIEKKGKDIFVVAGVENYESSAPIYSEYSIFLPFKSAASISLIAPQSTPMVKLYDYFDSIILPALKNMNSLTCSLSDVSMKNDTNINRMVLKARFRVSGISRLERSSS